MARRFLGIDLREQAVSAVVVVRERAAFQVEAHARIPVTAPAEADGHLAEALKALIRQIDPRGCPCAVSIPPGQVSFRNLRTPFHHPHKIRQILPFELEPALAQPVEDLSIGFQLLTPREKGSAAAAGLLAAAVPRERLNGFLEALAGVDIHPDRVTVGGYEAARRAASRINPGDGLLLDLDDRHCAVFALSAGEIKSVRAFSVGRARGGEALCAGVLQTLRAMEETLPGSFSPGTVFTAGPWPGGTEQAEALAEKLRIPVERVDFSRDAAVADRDREPSLTDGALALALAAADGSEGINFRPGPAGLRKLWVENRPSALRTIALACVLLLLAMAGILADASAQKRRLEGLNRQIAALFTETFPDVRAVVDPLQQMRVKVQEARRAAGSVEAGQRRMRAVDILREISLRIPASMDVDLDQAMIGPEGVRISGTTSGFDAVDRIKNSLAGIPGFESVGISSATVEKSSGKIQFKLNLAP